jgi:hypothetical protein
MPLTFVNLYDVRLVSVCLSLTSLQMYLEFSFTKVSKMGNMLFQERREIKAERTCSLSMQSIIQNTAICRGSRIADR